MTTLVCATRGIYLAAATLLLVVACDRTSEQQTPPRDSLAAGPSTSAGPKPPMKEYAAPAPERLGTLPAGIGVSAGQMPENAVLADLSEEKVDLADMARRRGPLLIVFYRGGWCPYCNFEIHELSEAFPEYQKRGILPVAISVDRPSEAAETAATYEIPFPVLSDPDLRAHEAFGVVHAAEESEVDRLNRAGIDLEAASGRDHHKFAIPAVFLVDRAFTVRWAHADPDYKVRPKTAQLIDVIDHLKLR